jgi:hypothetical protein
MKQRGALKRKEYVKLQGELGSMGPGKKSAESVPRPIDPL